MDPTTIIAVLALNLLCASGLFLAMGRRLPPRQGLGLLAAGAGLFGLAYVLRLLLGLTSPSWWAVVPDAGMFAGVLCFIAGVRQMVGRASGSALQFGALLAGFCALHVLAVAFSGTLGRHVWLNLVLGGAYSVLAGEALHEGRHGPGALRRALLLMAALMAGLASLTLARALWIALAGTGNLYGGWPAQLYYGYASVATLLLVPVLHWMVFTRLRQQLAELSTRDALSAVLNRQGLADAVARHWGTRPARSMTLLLIDIDDMKSINQLRGPVAGDELLRAAAKCLAEHMRGGDLLARVGGEEFLVACIDTTPLAARAMADRLREAMGQLAVPVSTMGTNLNCTVSIGVSRPCDAPHKFEAAWRETEAALRAAKQLGRDRVCMFRSLREVQVEYPTEPPPLAHDAQDTTPEGLMPQPEQRAAD